MPKIKKYLNTIEIKNLEDFDKYNVKDITKTDNISIFMDSRNKDLETLSTMKYKLREMIENIKNNRNIIDKIKGKDNRKIDLTLYCKQEDLLSNKDLSTMYNSFFNLKALDVDVNVAESLASDLFYSFDEVVNAEIETDILLEKVRKSNTSPLEKFLMIYDSVSNQFYKNTKDSTSKPRDLLSVLNQNENIVCVGYANKLAHLCNQVGIKCTTQSVWAKNDKGLVEGHENNLVSIDDDKYNVHGTFYTDACWDSLKGDEKFSYKKLNYCLLPLADKDHLSEKIVLDNSNQKTVYSKNLNDLYNSVLDSFVLPLMQNNDVNTIYLNILKTFGINKNDIDFDSFDKRAQEIVNDQNKIKAATELLKQKFAEKGIEDDIYSRHYTVPNSTALYSSLSLCLTVPPAKDILDTNLSRLKNLEDKQEQPIYKDSIKDHLDILCDYDNSSNNKDAHVYETELLKEYIKQSMITKYITEKMAEKMFTKPISLDTMINAQEQAYLHSGLSAQEAEFETQKKFYASVIEAKNCYNKDATNCFHNVSQEEIMNKFEERKQNKQIQQEQQ